MVTLFLRQGENGKQVLLSFPATTPTEKADVAATMESLKSMSKTVTIQGAASEVMNLGLYLSGVDLAAEGEVERIDQLAERLEHKENIAMKNWNPNLDKAALLRHMGSVSQLGGLKRYTFAEGRAKGVEAVDVVTGTGFDFTVLPGRCMDLAWARYKGVPVSYMSKAEITDASYLEQQGMEWLRSFHAGMLTTCGFSNVGGPCRDERRIFGLQSFGLHGRLTHIPANEVCCRGEWIDGCYVMTVQGLMRQSAVHGENLTLRRTITAVLGEPKLHIHDVIENEGHMAEPFMLLYHMNFGYPLLSPQSRLVVRSDAVRGADETAQAEIDQYASFHEPMHLRDERCYFHDLHADADGSVRIALVNDSLELGAVLRFNKNELPCLTEWKMLAEGEYVLGLEPGNTNPIGRLAAKERGMLQYLQPGEIRQTHIELEILDGGAAIRQAEQEIGGESI